MLANGTNRTQTGERSREKKQAQSASLDFLLSIIPFTHKFSGTINFVSIFALCH